MKKKIMIFGVTMIMVLGLCGCGGESKDKTEEEVTTETAISWDDMIPDYNKIFKNGTITTKYANGTTKDDIASAYFVIEDVTEEEYETYIKEAAKMYPNVISQSFDVEDGEPYGMFYSDDGKTNHTVLIILDVDPFSEKLTCNITCETYKTEEENKEAEE